MIGPLSPAPFQARSPTARLSAESAASLLSVVRNAPSPGLGPSSPLLSAEQNEEEGLEVVVTPALARITVVAGLGGASQGKETRPKRG